MEEEPPFDDEKEKLLNVKKAMQVDKLKEEVKNLELELKTLKQDTEANNARITITVGKHAPDVLNLFREHHFRPLMRPEA